MCYPTPPDICPTCGVPMDVETCPFCGGERALHECGEDTCCCLNPQPNVICEMCEGEGEFLICPNQKNHNMGKTPEGPEMSFPRSYTCLKCKGIDTTVPIKWRCLSCGSEIALRVSGKEDQEHENNRTPDPIIEVYDKFEHLDRICMLSDPCWWNLHRPTDQMAYEFWIAIKTYAKHRTKAQEPEESSMKRVARKIYEEAQEPETKTKKKAIWPKPTEGQTV